MIHPEKEPTDRSNSLSEPAADPARAAHSGGQVLQGQPDSPAQALSRLINTSLGYFKLGPLLGVGQSGAVFRALDTRDQGPVAVKVFVPDFSRSEEAVQRFVRAAKTLMPLRNLHLIDFYNAGRMNGHCWMSMELIEGPPWPGTCSRPRRARRNGVWRCASCGTSPGPWSSCMASRSSTAT